MLDEKRRVKYMFDNTVDNDPDQFLTLVWKGDISDALLQRSLYGNSIQCKIVGPVWMITAYNVK